MFVSFVLEVDIEIINVESGLSYANVKDFSENCLVMIIVYGSHLHS